MRSENKAQRCDPPPAPASTFPRGHLSSPDRARRAARPTRPAPARSRPVQRPTPTDRSREPGRARHLEKARIDHHPAASHAIGVRMECRAEVTASIARKARRAPAPTAPRRTRGRRSAPRPRGPPTARRCHRRRKTPAPFPFCPTAQPPVRPTAPRRMKRRPPRSGKPPSKTARRCTCPGFAPSSATLGFPSGTAPPPAASLPTSPPYPRGRTRLQRRPAALPPEGTRPLLPQASTFVGYDQDVAPYRQARSRRPRTLPNSMEQRVPCRIALGVVQDHELDAAPPVRDIRQDQVADPARSTDGELPG